MVLTIINSILTNILWIWLHHGKRVTSHDLTTTGKEYDDSEEGNPLGKYYMIIYEYIHIYLSIYLSIYLYIYHKSEHCSNLIQPEKYLQSPVHENNSCPPVMLVVMRGQVVAQI